MKKLLLSSIIVFGVCTFATAQADKNAQAAKNTQAAKTTETSKLKMKADAAAAGTHVNSFSTAPGTNDLSSPNARVAATNVNGEAAKAENDKRDIQKKQKIAAAAAANAGTAKQATDAQAKKANDN